MFLLKFFGIIAHIYTQQIGGPEGERSGVGMKWAKEDKRYKSLLMQKISPGNIMYGMVTIDNK